jgi:SAM-dependent methyltransferase
MGEPVSGASRNAEVQRRWTEYEDRTWSVGLDLYRASLRAFMTPAVRPRVLDIGCGPGQWSAAAAEEGAFVVGVDATLAVRAVCAAARHGYGLIRCRAEALPFRSGSFDLALLELVLPYVDEGGCLREVARILDRDGRVHGVCHGPGYYVVAAWREGLRLRRTALRRLAVLGYTLVHRMADRRRQRFETFQTPVALTQALMRAGFGEIETGLGGHPFDTRSRSMGLPVFFWFSARRCCH